jgi:hypothetical protein
MAEWVDDDGDMSPGLQEGAQRLTRDLREAARLLSPQQQRILVDLYYMIQDDRERAANQLRATRQEPNAWVTMMAGQLRRLEKLVAGALDISTSQTPVGRWAKSATGVGPVLAAGLAAYIDITKTPSVSSLWRLAGLDPSRPWQGRAHIEALLKAARDVEPTDWHAFLWICQALAVRPGTVLDLAGLTRTRLTVERATQLYTAAGGDLEAVWMVEREGDNVLLGGNLSKDVLVQCFARAYPRITFRAQDWERVTKTLAKRPWNTKLKTLCWKLGDSFMKFHNREDCLYGHIYAQRKPLEVEGNDQGRFRAQAAETLRERSIRDADTRAWYEGRYPAGTTSAVLGLRGATSAETQTLRNQYLAAHRGEPDSGEPMHPLGRLELRARRRAIKLYLSHYWNVAYWEHYHTLPQKPYQTAKDDALHLFIPPPGYEAIFVWPEERN